MKAQELINHNQSKIRLLLLLLATYGTGFLIMAFIQTPVQMGWYDGLKVSSLTPPDITFSIVWTTLYALIAWAAWLVWERGGHGYFYAQLVTQIVWSFTFFAAHWLWSAYFVLLLLCLLVILMIIDFYKYSKWAAILLIPYFLWTSFAAFLNLMVAILN